MIDEYEIQTTEISKRNMKFKHMEEALNDDACADERVAFLFILGDRKVSFPTLYPESFPGYRTAQVNYGFGEAKILLRVMLLIQATIKYDDTHHLDNS